MTGRAARVAAAAATALLAASQVRAWRAEQAYEAGIRARDPRTGAEASDQPARDVPGRFESYDRAHATDPANPLYALRSGQILLQRATRSPPPPDAAALREEAVRRLRAATSATPLDGRAHDALAQAHAAAGDVAAAIESTRRSVRTAPRRYTTLEQAAGRCVWLWRRTSDPDAMVLALEVARLGFEMKDLRPAGLEELRVVPGTRAVGSVLASPSGPGVGDLAWVLRGRPELRETAARLMEATRPEDAARLRSTQP